MVNLRYLILQKAPQEIAVSAREDDLGSAWGRFDLQQQGSHAIVKAETLTTNLLVAGHDPFRFHIETQGHGLRVDGLYHAAHNFTDLFAEVI